MAVREFDGVDDRIILAGGALGAICNGGYSIVVIAKPTSIGTDEPYIALQNGTSNLLGSLADKGLGGKLGCLTSTEDSNAIADVTAGDWQILASSKTSGTNHPRFHRKVLGSGAWTHIDGGGDNVANKATAVDRIEVATFLNGLGPKDCRIAALAVFAAQLSDANIEAIQTTPSTQKLADLGAVALWDLNQASTATAVDDLIGSADQTALTGTTVVTGDDPPGWTFGLAAGPPVNTSLPAITGTAQTGQTLTCSTGAWTNSPTSYAYQWKRNGVAISGATANTYALQAADEGQNVKCTVTATNASGSASADSNTVVPTPPSTILCRIAGAWAEKPLKVRAGGAWR